MLRDAGRFGWHGPRSLSFGRARTAANLSKTGSVGLNEIGIHGYSHENPIAMKPEQEEAVLDYSIQLATALAGRPPRGYVAPWREFSRVTNELLLKKGITYDHSLMHHDFQPYYVRVGDRWTPIDYSGHPSEWMKPLVRGGISSSAPQCTNVMRSD